MKFFSNLFSNRKQEEHQSISPDVSKIISAIIEAEEAKEIPLGKKIYNFEYGELQVRFDRDITHRGRICIFDGEEKLFSFTVFAKEGEYDILRVALESVLTFLNNDKSIKNLPDNKVLKGFYHHH